LARNRDVIVSRSLVNHTKRRQNVPYYYIHYIITLDYGTRVTDYEYMAHFCVPGTRKYTVHLCTGLPGTPVHLIILIYT